MTSLKMSFLKMFFYHFCNKTANTRPDTTTTKKFCWLCAMGIKRWPLCLPFFRPRDPFPTIEGHGLLARFVCVCVCLHALDIAALTFCFFKQHMSIVKWHFFKTNPWLLSTSYSFLNHFTIREGHHTHWSFGVVQVSFKYEGIYKTLFSLMHTYIVSKNTTVAI